MRLEGIKRKGFKEVVSPWIRSISTILHELSQPLICDFLSDCFNETGFFICGEFPNSLTPPEIKLRIYSKFTF